MSTSRFEIDLRRWTNIDLIIDLLFIPILTIALLLILDQIFNSKWTIERMPSCRDRQLAKYLILFLLVYLMNRFVTIYRERYIRIKKIS